MTKEDFKVNCIYWWRKHKETIIGAFAAITFPLWIIPCLIIDEVSEHLRKVESKDKDWCFTHSKPYPEDVDSWSKRHEIVKSLKKEHKRALVEFEKELIRRELKARRNEQD